MVWRLRTAREEDNEQTEQAFGASWIGWIGNSGNTGQSVHRQRRGKDRDRVVATGLRAREDAAFKAIVAAYEKASGNTIEASITPFAPLMQKIVSALTIGDVADVMAHDTAAAAVVPQNA
jgi:hypothetical protein